MKTLLVSAALLLLCRATFAQNPDSPPKKDPVAPVTIAEKGFQDLKRQGLTVVAEPVANTLTSSFENVLRSNKRGSIAQLTVNYPAQFAFPAVSAEEVILFMTRSDQILSRWWHPAPVPLRTNDSATFWVVNLVRRLEKRGVNRVALASLEPEDRKIAEDLLIGTYLEEASKGCRGLLPYLKRMPVGLLVKNPVDKQGLRLQYVLPDKKDAGIYLFDFNNAPDPNAATAAADRVESITLGELVKDLNTRSSTVLSVAPELADKPVVVRNAETQTPAALLRAIAEMYQLRVLNNGRTLKLASPTANAASLAQVQTALMAIMPRPLRAWAFTTPEPALDTGERRHNPLQYQYTNALFTYLNQVFETKVKDKKIKELAVSELTPQERGALAVALVHSYLSSTSLSMHRVPQWVPKYDEIVVEVGSGADENGEKMGYVRFLDAEGKPMVEVSGARFSRVPENP